jgi:hypothetical protein
MARVHSILVRQFEALTVLSQAVTGEWREQEENHVWYLIAVPQSRISELEVVVAAIGKELGQKQMFFRAGPPSVRLIDIDDDTPPLSEPR